MNTRILISAVLSVWACAGLSLARAQGPTPPPPAATPAAAETSVFPAETDIVLLDVIVRDKRDRDVPDLAPEELEVYEDGVRQKIQSFRHVGATRAAVGIEAGAAAAHEPSARVPKDTAPTSGRARLVTLVFDRLSANARRLAQDAAMNLVKTQMAAETLVAVVRLDSAASLVQAHTSDPELVRQAIQRATAGVVGKDAGQAAPGSHGTADAAAASESAGSAEARSDAVAVIRRKLYGLDSGSMGDETLAQSFKIDTLHSLARLVGQSRANPGRKALVLFSEGMIVPPGLDHVFRSLVSSANRANVSFYAVDVRGLDLTTQLSAARSMLEQTAKISESQRLAGTGDNPLTQRHIGQDDMALTSLASNPVDTLDQLSRSTGGFLITETNDFSKGIAKIGADLRAYYEVAYVPSAAGDPGQFHKIDVRVARKGTRVRSRSGYFTSLTASASGLAPTVAAALAALSAATLPRDVETLTSVLRFGRDQSALEHVVCVEVPLGNIALSQDAATGRFRGHLTIFGLMKDDSGALVDVFGREYPIDGPLAELDATRAASVKFARRVKLAPGQYTLELVTRDAGADKAAAERRALAVNVPDASLSMSSLVVVGGLNPAGAADDTGDPLRTGDTVISPNLGRPIVPTPGRETMALYCIVYDQRGAKDTPTATLELSRDGTIVARGSGPLPQADARGQIQYLSTIPLSGLSSGEYRVKLTVSREQATAEETATVRIGS